MEAPQAGNSQVQLVVDRLTRTTVIHVPPGLVAGTRSALVLALHGYGGTGPRMESYSGFSRVADRGHFIVAYPNSAGLYWNSNGPRGLPDDVRFLGRLIGALEQRLCVDSTRVYATGVSNGGGMVALAGCELSRQLTAIAPVAGGYDGQPACHPARPLSGLEIHGTADQVVPYFGAGRRPTRNGLPPYVNGWARRDRCRGSATVQRLATRTVIYRWSACADGAAVEHIRIARGRHQWPGATPPDPGPPSTFCGACTIWRYFASPKP